MSKTDPLKKVKEILSDLEREVTKKPFPWRPSRYWLHGATEFLECNQVEKWLYTPLPLSKVAKSKALIHYDKWGEYLFEDGEYLDFSVTIQMPPTKEGVSE
jgi:hypothetical protein